MSNTTPRRLLFALATTAAVAACPTSDTRDAIRCGAGTADRNGVCIALPPVDDARCGEGTVENAELNVCEPVVDCGPGTVRDGDVCRPIAVCGEGTFFDRPTRSCVPEAQCGEGTVANPETRQCESPVVCGPGTVLDVASRECRPVPACTPGTVLDEDTGLCVGAVVCGEDQVVVNGQCVEPNEAVALDADVSEGRDENDPALGGVAEALELEAEGEQTIFVGGIDRPQDVNGDGVIDQDKDAWAFDAVAGDYLAIEIKSLGLPGPVFLIEGPRGYRRASTVGFEVEPRRELLVPFTGRYTITVVPGSFLSTGTPAGGLGSGYVGIVERRARPVPVDVTPGVDGATPTVLTGNLLGLDDNFFAIAAPPRSAVVVTFRGVPTETAPALIAMSDDDALLAEIQELGVNEWVGIFTPTSAEAFFVVDWRESFGPDDDFSIDVNFVPLVETGPVPSDATSQSGSVDIPTQLTAAFQFIVSEPQLIELDILEVTGPDVQIVDANGTFAVIDDDDLFFFFAGAGEYVVFVNNDLATDRVGAGLGLSLLTPAPLGSLELGGLESGTMTGADLVDTVGGPAVAWGVVDVPAGSTLALEVDVDTGDPDLLVFTAQGASLRGVPRPNVSGALHVVNDEARTLLVRLDTADNTTTDWEVTARVLPTPTLLEAEPNDTIDRATRLPALPAIVRGTIAVLESDLYRFELPEELPPGKAIQISFDDLGVVGALSSLTNATSVMVYDNQFQPLVSVPYNDDTLGTGGTPYEQGVMGANTRTYVGQFEGPGPFLIELVKRFAPTNPNPTNDYVLAVDVVDVQVEIEPNDEPNNADVIALNDRIVGYRTNTDLVDLYRFTLSEALGVGEQLRVRFDNIETNNAITFELRTAADVVVGSAARVLGNLVATNLAAGDYVLRVTGGGNLEAPYEFVVAVTDRAFEVEPNNEPATATDLGALTATAPIVLDAIRTVDDDFYTFTLAAPLADGQGLRVDASNTSDTTSLAVELHEASEGGGSTLLSSHTLDAAVVVSASAGTGPFFVRVVGATGEADHYRLRVHVAGRAEREDNATAATATVLPAGDFVVDGVLVRTSVTLSDTDVYRLDLAAETTMRFRWQNQSDTTAIRLSVRAADFTTELATASTANGVLPDIVLPAGTAYLVLSLAVNSSDHYRLTGTVTP